MSTPDETTNPAAAFTEAEVEAAALVAVEVSNKFAPADYRDMIRAALAAVAQSHHDRAVAEAERECAPRTHSFVSAGEIVYCLKCGRHGRDEHRAEVARLAGAVERVEGLAGWYDAQPNWREWRIGASIRAALTPATDEREESPSARRTVDQALEELDAATETYRDALDAESNE